jgi:phosphoglycolate phosphatase-like HAD superfamily hydrolase
VERMIETILFDVDGVFLSEDRYFDASALTIWELLYSNNYLGLAPEKFKTAYDDEEISRIRECVFKNDQILKEYKSRGLNANWDMIYITFCYHLIELMSQIKDKEIKKVEKWLEGEIDYDKLMEMKQVFATHSVRADHDAVFLRVKNLKETGKTLIHEINKQAEEELGIKTSIFKGKSKLWSICEHTSQEWYVGDEWILSSTGRPAVQKGKSGFLNDEKTLGTPEDIQALLRSIIELGIHIGIGTGRPQLETLTPFQHLNWLEFFDVNHIVTADDVLFAEKEYPESPSLSKPHPFSYLYAWAGKSTSLESILTCELPVRNGENILIVGDSLADLLAAKKMGCRFAAVLTGLSGKSARAEFERHQADYILDSVLDLKELLMAKPSL